MDTNHPDTFATVTGQIAPERLGVRTQTTKDHEAIQRWAAEHQAEPATGEATASGPATVDVNDGGVGIRFNFPGFARFRPIGWNEWFENFDQNRLLFVFEGQDQEQVAARAHELSRSHDGETGRDREDWFRAERHLQQQAGGASPSVRYCFIKDEVAASR
jgi:hypothetical protein